MMEIEQQLVDLHNISEIRILFAGIKNLFFV